MFYLMSRGLNESDALNMIVMGFLEPFTKELPMEYAVESEQANSARNGRFRRLIFQVDPHLVAG